MNTVNLGPKYTHRLTLRMTDEQYDFLVKISSILGVSPSDYLRMSVNSAMISAGKTIDDMASGKYLDKKIEEQEGAVGTVNENVKTDKHDKLQ